MGAGDVLLVVLCHRTGGTSKGGGETALDIAITIVLVPVPVPGQDLDLAPGPGPDPHHVDVTGRPVHVP